MAVNSCNLFYYLLYTMFTCFVFGENHNSTSKSHSIGMSKEEKMSLREEARDMFYHAYNAYMDNAYPADELMPLSCKGRWRSLQSSRGDIDDTLGNFSLTLIDTLDTLAILGDVSEFEHAAKLITENVNFDSDVVVSVFETNIRVLGGLLSGHVMSEYFQLHTDRMQWYTGQLLELAKDIGYRLLPAFNTTTGIPHGRINLRHGLKTKGLEWSVDTCTACAGTMILEMAALSRLSGLPVFEAKAHRAMDGLWAARNRDSDLMGTVLNVDSGDWIRRDSGVGAGIDSYYEYCLKAYVLLGQDKYLSRFDKHYSAVMKYISRGPLLLDVHMHKPLMTSRNFMDALLAFWPGLQVLKGDIKPAVEIHEMLYQVMQRHNFIPEAFTTDFQVHWGQHPLRPEFLESTYFLYKSTGDAHYLDVGRSVLRALQTHARVPCGYAAVRDVRTGAHEDRMDSFVLAETFKYLYLLFSEEEDLPLNLDHFIFTTEAHLLPLSLTLYNFTHHHTAYLLPLSLTLYNFTLHHTDNFDLDDIEEDLSRQCPSTLGLFPHSVREPMKNLVAEKKCATPRLGDTRPRKLTLNDFQPENAEHKKILHDYGLALESHPNGTFYFRILDKNLSKEDAEESGLFIQELRVSASGTSNVESFVQNLDTRHSQAVAFTDRDGNMTVLSTGSAQFGRILNQHEKVTGKVRVSHPTNACSPLLNNPEELTNSIVLADRGSCMFVEKARRLQAAGAAAVIIIDNVPGTSSLTAPFFLMSSDGNVSDISIPVVFLYTLEARQLMSAVADNPSRLVSVCHMNAAWDARDIASQNVQGVTTQVVTGQVVQGVTSQVGTGQVVQGVTSQVGTGQVVQGVTTQVRVDDVVQSFPVLDKTEVRRESVDTRGEEVSVEHFESFSKNGNDDKTLSENSNDESISDSQPEMTTKKIFKSNIPNSIDSMSIDSNNVEGGGERKTKLPELESPPELTQDTETLKALLKSIIVDKTIGTLLDKVVSERLNGQIVSSDETNLHSNSENNNLKSQSNIHSNSQSNLHSNSENNLHSSHKDRDIVQDILAQLSTVDLSSFQAPFGENSPKLGSTDRHKESLKSHEVNTKTSDTLNTEAGNMYSSEKARKRSLTDLPSYEEDEELSVLPPSGERQSVRDEL